MRSSKVTKAERYVIITVVAMNANFERCSIEGSYRGAVGNLCGSEKNRRYWASWRELPTGGFHVTYAEDSTATSVIGSSGVEDVIDCLKFGLNYFLHFVLLATIWHF